MTLSTRVAIRLPDGHDVTPRQMLDNAVTLLLQAGGDSRTLEDVSIQERPYDLSTTCGQGLPAWTFVHFEPDGPYMASDQTKRQAWPEDYEDDDPAGDKISTPACTYLLDFDTAYGYHQNGLDCNSLHALTIVLLWSWVSELGGTLLWHNEYAGTWHEFEDTDGWGQFLGAGREAMSWFQDIVKPAIEAQVARVQWS
ncbi:hypothetical protein R2325_16905 [Mycobacteroides chelonae]|uniref:hypothetical protein n=1 Tax=Mycobacteroides chelonae TaxID=1774 RepID=UPI002DEA2EB4|nr:hypothetical protein [Mycobacteroides chelonae]MEC4871715.1 hypothetical protein [Mycobacteroides chelonae]